MNIKFFKTYLTLFALVTQDAMTVLTRKKTLKSKNCEIVIKLYISETY